MSLISTENRRGVLGVAALVVLFLVSVALRVPYLDDGLSGEHSWTTSHALVTHSVWNERGIVACRFLPIVSFGAPGDKHIGYPIGNLESSATGDYYYTSHPPLGYILPYLVLRPFGAPSELKLQIFSLATHFACALLIYLSIGIIARRKALARPEIPSLIGASIYLFAPIALWFHGPVYAFEVFAQLFFLLGVYVFLRILDKPEASVRLSLALFAAAFCMAYTEWLGVFFAMAVGLYALLHFRKKPMRLAFAAVALGAALAVGLTLYQYSQIDGFHALAGTAAAKLKQRSGFNAESAPAQTFIYSKRCWRHLRDFYNQGYGLLPLAVALSALVAARGLTLKVLPRVIGPMERAVLLITVLPVVMHHVIFFNFTALHTFSTVKTGAFLSMFAGIAWCCLLAPSADGQEPGRRARIVRWALGGVVACALLVSAIFFVRTHSRTGSQAGKALGEAIASQARPDEVVFMDVMQIYPQTMFYARRNIAIYEDDARARELIRRDGARRGVLFVPRKGLPPEVRYVE